jgi:membrane protein
MDVKTWVPFSRKVMHVMRCAVSEWMEHRAASKGAALAFYSLFSLAPILVLVIAVAGFFYGTEAAQGQLMGQLRGLVGAQGAETIQAILAGARNKDSGLIATIVASVLLVVGATSAFAELKDSLDEIWDVPPPKDASWWDTIRTRLLSFGLILTLGLLLMTSLVISAALNVVEKFIGGMWHDATVILGWVASGFSFLVIATMFGAIYKLLPRTKLSWHDVTIGALGTAVLFILGKFVIGLYIGNSGATSSFGAAGSLIALLLWVYYSAQIFFLGAEFARQYALQMGSLRKKEAVKLSPALAHLPDGRPERRMRDRRSAGSRERRSAGSRDRRGGTPERRLGTPVTHTA